MMMAKFVLIIMKFLLTLVLLMLAPTTSYARSSLPLQNYEKSNLLSYKDCLHNCNKCACTQIWPPDLSFCVCLDSIQSEKGKEKSEYMPYKECLQSCESEIECACTLIYPPELSQCICLHPKQPAEHVGRRSRGSTSTTTPYRQCVRSCETCACTLVYPPELSECICLDYPAILLNSEITRGSSAAGSNGPNGYGKGNETSHELIPFMECIQSCDNCACTRIWPPSLSQCLCLN